MIVPVQCEYFALEGVSELIDTLIRIVAPQSEAGRGRNSAGDVLMIAAPFTPSARRPARLLYDQVFATVIPRNVRLAEAPSFGKAG